MFKAFVLSIFMISSSQAFSYEKETMSCNKSPKAISETYVGDASENLAVLNDVQISPIAKHQEFENLPIWFSKDPDTPRPKIYNGIFWEIEPMGEYLYYLAGDFTKNEKGLLRYPTPTTSMFVEVNFEDDVINVAKHDGANEQEISEKQADVISFVLDLTIGELGNRVPASNNRFDDQVSYVSLRNILSNDVNGLARLIVHKPIDGGLAYISLMYQEFREPISAAEFPRYTKISMKSSLQSLKIDTFVNQFIKLVNKYSNMPYICLSGTTRS